MDTYCSYDFLTELNSHLSLLEKKNNNCEVFSHFLLLLNCKICYRREILSIDVKVIQTIRSQSAAAFEAM